MTKASNKSKYPFWLNENRYWLTLLNVAEPSGLKQEIDNLIELRNILSTMAQNPDRQRA